MAKRRTNTSSAFKKRQERIIRSDSYANRVKTEFARSVDDVLDMYKRKPSLDNGVMFSFDSQSKRIQQEVEEILRRLHANVVAIIHAGITQEWSKANEAIDELIADSLGKKVLKEPKLAGWFDRNEKAMNAFMNRSDNGMNLSQRIWKETRQLRDEMEVAMSVAIGEGESASQMSRKVRQYLNDPDLMFRRFRYKDEEGNWQTKWKKKVLDDDGKYHFIDYDKDDYKVGRGMYKSAYKNAMRVTRTETNIAYRRADNERWQGLDFVLGQHIETSGSHTDDDKDICDELAGDYPKDFLFDGWHPQCYCICTPILASEKEMENAMDAALEGKEYNIQDEEIDTYPKGFQQFIEDNEDSLQEAMARGTAPYFIENNMDVVQAIYDGEDLTKPQEEESYKTDALGNIRDALHETSLKPLEIQKWDKTPSLEEIVGRVGGLDRTKGSCASLSLAYVGNLAGMKVLDYRDGLSRLFFSQGSVWNDLSKAIGGETIRHTNDFKACNELFKKVEVGKEYILTTGEHAAIIRKTKDNGYQYLELQDRESSNGFKSLTNDSLKDRFKCSRRHYKKYIGTYELSSNLIPVESLMSDKGFQDLLTFINTEESKQNKGEGGGKK